MYIDKIKMNDFGKLHDREIEFKEGLNIVYSKDAKDKTSVKDFVMGMMFDIDPVKSAHDYEDVYKAEKPAVGSFGGSADVYQDGKHYLVERNFDKDNKKTTLTEVLTGKNVSLPKDNSLEGVLFNVDERSYKDTLCLDIEDVKRDQSIVEAFKNYMIRMTSTKSLNVNVNEAVVNLLKSKDQMAGGEASQAEAIREELKEKKLQMMQLDAAAEELESLYDKRATERMNVAWDSTGNATEEEDASAKKVSQGEMKPDGLYEEKDRSVGNKPMVVSLIFLGVMIALLALIWILPGFSPALKGVLTILVVVGMIIALVFAIKGKKDYDEEIHRKNQLILDSRQRERDKVEMFKSQEDIHMEELKAQVDQLLVVKTEYDALKNRYEEIKKTEEKSESEKQAVDAAIEAISKLSNGIYDAFGAKANIRIAAALTQISGGKYTEIVVTDNLEVLIKDGINTMDISALGEDKIAMLYIACRTIMADLMYSDVMPMIVEDVASSISDRSVSSVLIYIAKHVHTQCVFLTDNPNMKAIIKGAGIQCNYIEL